MPQSKVGWKAGSQGEGGNIIIHQMKISVHRFEQSFPEGIHTVALKNDRSKYVENEKRAWERSSNFHTARDGYDTWKSYKKNLIS